MLQVGICRWILLFQDYYFDVIVKPRKSNVGPNHLSHITLGKEGTFIDDALPDSYLFRVIMVDE